MYIIDDNNIKKIEIKTLGMTTGNSILEYSWIDNKLKNSGIFFFNEVVYYKYYTVALFILKHPHLIKLYNSYNLVNYVNSEIDFYNKIKNLLEGYRCNKITEKYESISLLLNDEITNIDFFINYGRNLLKNEHIKFCSEIVKNDEILYIVDKLDNINLNLEYETLFLRDIQLLDDFNDYCIKLLENIDEMLVFIEKNGIN